MLKRELNKSFSGCNSSIQYNVVNSTDFLVGVLTCPKASQPLRTVHDEGQNKIAHAHIPIHLFARRTWRKENIGLINDKINHG